jgi:hypothetical protein
VIMSTPSTSYQRRAMAGGDHFDFLAEHAAAKILDRHPGRLDGIFAAVIRIDPGLVVQNADLDALRRSRRRQQKAARRNRRQPSRFHLGFPWVSVPAIIAEIFNSGGIVGRKSILIQQRSRGAFRDEPRAAAPVI